MEIHEKIEIFQKSCDQLLRQEVTKRNQMLDAEIEQQIKNELQEYEEKEEFTYQKKIEKLEKEFNKQIYSSEMESKKEVLNQKKVLQKDLKKEIIQILKDFTKTPEYKDFLFHRIEETLQKLTHTNHAILGMLERDKEKYGNEIGVRYSIAIKVIEEPYIGGCILEDKVAGISIDHTLLNSVQEKLENELR